MDLEVHFFCRTFFCQTICAQDMHGYLQVGVWALSVWKCCVRRVRLSSSHFCGDALGGNSSLLDIGDTCNAFFKLATPMFFEGFFKSAIPIASTYLSPLSEVKASRGLDYLLSQTQWPSVLLFGGQIHGLEILRYFS